MGGDVTICNMLVLGSLLNFASDLHQLLVSLEQSRQDGDRVTYGKNKPAVNR